MKIARYAATAATLIALLAATACTGDTKIEGTPQTATATSSTAPSDPTAFMDYSYLPGGKAVVYSVDKAVVSNATAGAAVCDSPETTNEIAVALLSDRPAKAGDIDPIDGWIGSVSFQPNVDNSAWLKYVEGLSKCKMAMPPGTTPGAEGMTMTIGGWKDRYVYIFSARRDGGIVEIAYRHPHAPGQEVAVFDYNPQSMVQALNSIKTDELVQLASK